MRPQKQAFHHKPHDGQIGDCHRTVIACLLDLDRDEVPHFALPDFADTAAFHAKEAAFLRLHGLTTVVTYFDCDLADVLATQKGSNPGVYYILGGMSATGANHSVIGLDDGIEWDPSITNAGIVGPLDNGYYSVSHLIPLHQTTRGAMGAEGGGE